MMELRGVRNSWDMLAKNWDLLRSAAAAASTEGQGKALRIAFFGGAVMGLSVASLGLIGIGGFYFPFTGEANINVWAPAWQQPHTRAHEMSHQRFVEVEVVTNVFTMSASTAMTTVEPAMTARNCTSGA